MINIKGGKKSKAHAVAGQDRRLRKSVVEPNYITRSQGERLLDKQARKYLGMSGKEFRDKYRSGQLRSSDHPDVTRVSFLIPLSED